MIGVTTLNGGGGYWAAQPGGEILNINAATGGVTAAAQFGAINAAALVTNSGQSAAALIVENTITNETARVVVTNSPNIFLNCLYNDPATGTDVQYALNIGGAVLTALSNTSNGGAINISLANQSIEFCKGGPSTPHMKIWTNPTNNSHFYFENVPGAAGSYTGRQIRVTDINGNFIGHLNIFQ